MDGGNYYITETYKSTPKSEAKTHDVEEELIVLLLQQRTIKALTTKGLVASATPTAANRSLSLLPGTLPDFATYPRPRYGITIDMWLHDAAHGGADADADADASSGGATGARGAAVKTETLLAVGGGALTIVRMANGTTTISLRAHNTR